MKKTVAEMESGATRKAGAGAGQTAYSVLPFLQYPTGGAAGAAWSGGGSVSPCPSPRGSLESSRGQQQQSQQQQQQVLVPTTFVQADTSSFKEVVQRLTGASEEDGEKMPVTMPARYVPKQPPPAPPAPPPAPAPAESGPGGKPGIEVGPRKSSFKLHERRQNMRNLQIGLGITLPPRNTGRLSPRGSGSPFGQSHPPELSPSVLNMMNTALVLSPVTPLGSDPFDCPSSANCMSEEERAIAEKGFYLHPSPLSTPRSSEPELLPLFPVHSPRDSESSSS